MKKNYILACAIGALMTLTACTPLQMLQHTYKTGKQQNVSNNLILQKPIIAELEVREAKVTNTTTVLSKQYNIEDAKQLALAELLRANKADILVSPDYDIVSDMNQITVTVTGYAASYKNFKSITANDSNWIKQSLRVNANPNASVSNASRDEHRTISNIITQPKKKGGKAVGAILLVVSLVVLLPLIIISAIG